MSSYASVALASNKILLYVHHMADFIVYGLTSIEKWPPMSQTRGHLAPVSLATTRTHTHMHIHTLTEASSIRQT